jgi:CBS domain-containing protein
MATDSGRLARDLRSFEKMEDRLLEQQREKGRVRSPVDRIPEQSTSSTSSSTVVPEGTTCPLHMLLEETSINQIAGPRDVFVVREDTRLSDALGFLAQHRMLSLPVQAKDSVDIIGFVDVLDVLTHIVRLCSEGKSHPEADEAFENTIMMYQKGFNFASTPVSAIIDSSARDPLVPVYGNGTLSQLIEEAFVRGVHRVPVYNKVNEVVTNIISQSDIITFIMNRIERAGDPAAVLGPLAGKTADQLRLGTKPVISMTDDLPAFKALQLMVRNRVSAVAVVDKVGQLMADFSATEVRGLSVDNFPSLRRPVVPFLEQSRSRIGRPERYPFSTPIICTGDTPLEMILLKLHTHGLHRLWIVDEMARPIGVITLTDVMRLLVPPQEPFSGGEPTNT